MYKIIESRSGNNLSTDSMKSSVLIEAEADLKGLPEELAIGSFAFTADFSGMWCKGLDREWHKIGG